MGSFNKVFNDNVKSKLRELYADVDSIYECRPRIVLPTGRTVTLNDLETRMKNAVPNYRERPLDVDVESTIDYATVEKVTKSLLNLPKNSESCCIKLIKISNFKNVMFQHAKLETATGSQNGKLRPPCFKLEVPACLPNTVQNINTGYVIDVCTEIENYQISDGAIVKSAKCYPQKKLVVIPQVLTKNKNVVPQLCARDYEDSGPYTISLLNRTGESCTVFVYLYTYRCVLPHASVRFENHEDADGKVLKPKDSRTGRYVYNLSAGVRFDMGSLSADRRKIEFPCFDGKKTGHDELLSTRVAIDNLCTFFSTRKREWCDSKLFTVSGLFRPGKEYVAPVVCERSQYNTNTHGCVFLDSRMTLFTVDGTLSSRHLLMNGSMFDLSDYKTLKRARSAMVRDLYLLRSGSVLVRRFDENVYDKNDLMLIYDYQITLSDDDEFLKKIYAKRDNESDLFNCSNSSMKRTVSSRLYKNMMTLVDRFVLHDDDDDDKGEAATAVVGDTVVIEPTPKRLKTN